MVYMYHSFLVHSSADGHLGCFHVLAMTNSAAIALLLNNRNQHTLWVHFIMGLQEAILRRKARNPAQSTPLAAGQLQTLTTQAALGKNRFKVGREKVLRHSHSTSISWTNSLNFISFSHRVFHREFSLLNWEFSPVLALTGSSLPCDSSVNLAL